MFFMGWLCGVILMAVFAPSLSVLAFAEAMCGISWGVFQTLTTTYACEIVSEGRSGAGSSSIQCHFANCAAR